MEITVEKNAKTQLLWIGMGSILMFFAGLTSAYIVRKPEGDWLDFVLPEYFTFSTIVIVLSSLLLFFVKGRLKNKKSIYRWSEFDQLTQSTECIDVACSLVLKLSQPPPQQQGCVHGQSMRTP